MESKRWLWMLAVPYVVNVSSGLAEIQFRTAPKNSYGSPAYHASNMVLSCEIGKGSDCAWIYDLAEAMNAAHERRTNECRNPYPLCLDNHGIEPGIFHLNGAR